MTNRKGNFLEADELLALIEAAAAIDEPVSKDTLARIETRAPGEGDSGSEASASRAPKAVEMTDRGRS